MIYVIPLWIVLLMFWPWLKRQRLASKFSFTRVPLTFVVMHGLFELMQITETPAYFWPVPTVLGIAWLVLICQWCSWALDILDGRVARDSKTGGTKWGRFWDATTDKLSIWPIAILLWCTYYAQLDLFTSLTWHLPVTALLLYDLWSTSNHYRKAKTSEVKAEVDTGLNRQGHIFGQAKHWSWCLMVGAHLLAMLPVIPEHGSSISNALARFGLLVQPWAFVLAILAAVCGLKGMQIRWKLAKIGDDVQPPAAHAAMSLEDSAAEAA